MNEPQIIRLVGVVIALIIALLVRKDAKSRGMKAAGWAVGVFLMMIVFLPLYFIMRKPRLDALSPEEGETDLEEPEESGQSADSTGTYSKLLPERFRLLPHLIVGSLWGVFSVWVCVREHEIPWMFLLVFLGFLPYLIEKLPGTMFSKQG
jgi:4-amino-4-deoxy-L-arabinose transferase-like glycosyltransferase